MRIGPRFKQLREKRGLNQQQVADIVGLPRQSVQQFEAVGSNPSFSKLETFISAIGVTVAEFFNSNVPDQYPNQDHHDLHEKLQEILEAGGDWENGIRLNIDSIHKNLVASTRKKPMLKRRTKDGTGAAAG